MALCEPDVRRRTAVVPARLNGADYRRAHEASHALAKLWNLAVVHLRAEWGAGRHPSIYDFKRWLTSLPVDQRPFHAHSAQAVAFDLFEACRTATINRKNGLKVRYPWRKHTYRPLSFTAGFGWRVTSNARLSLSLGRGRTPITVQLPTLVDPETAAVVPTKEWGEIQLCWDRDARLWSLHISVPSQAAAPRLDPAKSTAVDEGIINPMTLSTMTRDADGARVIEVTVINGREARAIKRRRNKAVGQLSRKISRCADGSRRRRKLVRAKKRAQARAKAQLRDFNHQVSRKAADFAIEHGTGSIMVGDVRGIEDKTRQKRRASPSTRQQLSQWERGAQEALLAHKCGVKLEHIDESYSSKACPACLTRNRPKGRRYRCRQCSFGCHRDVVGAINILMRATYGQYTRIDPAIVIRVKYLRAVPRWSNDQRGTHRKVARRKATARSRAQNRAAGVFSGSGDAGKITSPSASGSAEPPTHEGAAA